MYGTKLEQLLKQDLAKYIKNLSTIILEKMNIDNAKESVPDKNNEKIVLLDKMRDSFERKIEHCNEVLIEGYYGNIQIDDHLEKHVKINNNKEIVELLEVFKQGLEKNRNQSFIQNLPPGFTFFCFFHPFGKEVLFECFFFLIQFINR